jgi:hypothetical protein
MARPVLLLLALLLVAADQAPEAATQKEKQQVRWQQDVHGLADRIHLERSSIAALSPRLGIVMATALQATLEPSVIPLPAGYRDFVTAFGPGELGQYFRIYSPSHGSNISRANLDKYVDSFASNRTALAARLIEKELVMRMFPFSNTIGGDVIAWDPLNVIDNAAHEYGIYVIPRDRDEIIFLAGTFRSFVEDVCLGYAFAEKLVFHDVGSRMRTLGFSG